MRTILVSAIVVVAGFLLGCQASLFPFYDQDEAYPVAELVGSWHEVGGDGAFAVALLPDSSMEMYEQGEGKVDTLALACFEVDEIQFMDISPQRSVKDAGLFQYLLLPTHLAAEIEFSDDTLTILVLDADWVRHKVESGELNTPHAYYEGGMVLTGNTEDLQEVLTQALESDSAFTESSYLRVTL